MMTDLALWRLDCWVLPVIFGLVHCRGSVGSCLKPVNGLLNSGRLFGLRRITIFLSGRRINASDFKSRGNQLLPADHGTAHRALVPLMVRGVRRHPSATRWGPDRWLLAHHRQLSLIVILWRIGVGGRCGRIQFWIFVDSTATTRCRWRNLTRSCPQRIIEVWEIRLVETVYGVLRELLLSCLGLTRTAAIDVWRRRRFVSMLLDVWQGAIISLWSIILRSKKNLHCFFICQPSSRLLRRLSRLCPSLLMR